MLPAPDGAARGAAATPARSCRPCRRWRCAVLSAGALALPLLIALLLALPGPLPPDTARAEPNAFEQQQIEAEALEVFRRVITLWREEIYFELYDFGMAASRARLKREDFAQRMVELSWVPVGELNPKHLVADFRYRTAVYIKVRIPYRHKFNPERRFSKEQTLLMLHEEGEWRVDLVQLIRSPFAGV